MLELQQQVTHDWAKMESIKHFQQHELTYERNSKECHLNAAQYQQKSAIKEQLAPQNNSSNHDIQVTMNPQQWRSQNQ